MNQGIKALLLLILISSAARMQAQQTSASFDTDYAARFQDMLDSVTEALNTRGISMALIIPVQGTFIGVSGESHPGVPITPDMRFGVGSNTKLFTAVTLLRLQETGVLSLEDHLYDWLPSYPYIDSSATIRQLLQHQTGFFDYFNDNPSMFDSCMADSDRVWTAEEVLATIGPPHFPVGQRYSYCNTNYLLAGMIIEAATGVSTLNKYHEFIFDPLSMDSTFVPPAELPNGPVAHEFYDDYDLGDLPQPAFYSIASSAGSIFSTANEMATWYKKLFDHEVVSDASVHEILNCEHTGSFYGLGIVALYYDGHYSYYHGGGTIGYNTFTLYDADTEATLSLLTNDKSTNLSAYIVEIFDLLYHHLPKKEHDAGITAIAHPSGNICATNIAPIATLKNFGTSPLTSVTINYYIDGGSVTTFDWTGNLTPDSTVSVSLPALNADAGSHHLYMFTSNPNGAAEGYPFNDDKAAAFIINDAGSAVSAVEEGFESYEFPPPGWYRGDDPIFSWGRTPLSPYAGLGSGVMNNYNGSLGGGAKYDLILPEINLDGISSPQLSFVYAYKYRGSLKDSLRVLLSDDCGETWNTLFYSGGNELASGSSISVFYPLATDWKTKNIDLSLYSGNVLIKFEDISYGGNNLYVDNISIGSATSVQPVAAASAVTVYPNPFHSTAMINPGHVVQRGELFIMNSMGQQVRHLSGISGSEILIDRKGLTDGIYFFRLVEPGGITMKGSMVVK